jgi:3-oxoacyl-[acyl-carrier-protein] synthase-3
VAASDEAASDLAARAVEAALKDAGLTANDLDLLVLATSTPDELGPSTACRVQAALGASQAVAFDVSAACSGWLFGARVAQNWLGAAPDGRYAAVVGVEAYSRFLDGTDRGTAVLFADGAGATILGAVSDGYGFAPIELGSDGTGADDVLIPGGGSRHPADHTSVDDGMHRIHMDGRAVRDFIVEIFPEVSTATLQRSGLTTDDIALVISHQPNPVLLRRVCEEAGFDADRLVLVGDQVGNIGAGSLPFALAEANAQGMLKTGDHVLIVAFGAGLTYGGTVLTWGTDPGDGR